MIPSGRLILIVIFGTCLVAGGRSRALAETAALKVQSRDPSAQFVGTWRSGNFAYTFSGNGTYVYVGAMGGAMMRTQISAQGTYEISGDKLIVSRQRGVLTTSQNYRQDLGPQTTIFRWRLGNTPSGAGLQLIFPDGGPKYSIRSDLEPWH